MALKLTGPKKWLQCKRALQKKHGVVVNFSDHDGYYTAYRYISKSDENVYHSPNHEELSGCNCLTPQPTRLRGIFRPDAGLCRRGAWQKLQEKVIVGLNVNDLLLDMVNRAHGCLTNYASAQRNGEPLNSTQWVYSGRCRRPTFDINEDQLNYLIEQGFKVAEISNMLGVGKDIGEEDEFTET